MAMLMAARPRPKPQVPGELQQTLRDPPPMPVDAVGATPEQVARQRKIAAELAKNASDYSPVGHWTQGLGRVVDAFASNLEESRANEAEKAGRSGASDAWSKVMAETDPQKRTAAALALANNPWLGESAKAATGAMVANEFRPPTDDQREYDAAVKGGFKGTFMDYMKALKTPVVTPPQGYVMAPGSTPDNPKVVRMEGLPADPAAAPKPTVQKAEDEDIAAIQGVQSINAQLDGINSQIDSGDLNLGFFNNLMSKGQNLVGASDKNSIAYATMMSTLEKMRNDSLRLNSGVQTEGDAVRAWNELVSNVNDPKVVKAQIARIKELNTRAAEQRGQLINIRRQRNNMEAFDPATLALPGTAPAAPPAPPQPGQFTPTDGTPPQAAPQGGPQPGMIEDGMQFIGGNPADPNSWKPAPQGGPEMAAPPGPQMAPPAAPQPAGWPWGGTSSNPAMGDLRQRQEEMTRRHKKMLMR